MQAYQDLCKQYPTFRERSENVDVAVEVSLQPWRAFQVRDMRAGHARRGGQGGRDAPCTALAAPPDVPPTPPPPSCSLTA